MHQQIRLSSLVSLLFFFIQAQEYTPEVLYSLDPAESNTVANLSFTVIQSGGEIDTEVLVIDSDGGFLDIDGLISGQDIGLGHGFFTDGNCDVEFANEDGNLGPDYTCNAQLDSEVSVELSIYYLNTDLQEAGAILTITQSNNPEYPIGFSPAGVLLSNILDGEDISGISIEVAYLQPDPGSTTAGYISLLEFQGIFTTPDADSVQMSCEFTPEIGDPVVDIQSIDLFNTNVPGDVNFDGALDVIDIVLIVHYILGHATLTPEQINSADVDSTGFVDIIDVVLLVNIILNP